MTDWKQQIEEHIADLHEWGRHDEASIIKALLDVAVAADAMREGYDPAWFYVQTALDKLREVGDE